MVASVRDYQISVICMAVLSSCFLIVAIFGFFFRPLEVHEYGVVVDISSYDVEFNLYRWKNRKTIQSTAQVKKKYTISCDVSVHQDPFKSEDIREKMYKCVKFVISHIENYELYNSTIFIYGTEKTRVMCEKDSIKCNTIFGLITEVLNAFSMNALVSNVRPLSGFDEALFGWISINYKFKSIHVGRKGVGSYSGLDVKNYSVLLSIETDKPFTSPSTKYKSTQYELYGHKFDVVGLDMMCFGVNQGYGRSIFDIIKGSASSWSSKNIHPCHHGSFNQEVDISDTLRDCNFENFKSATKVFNVKGQWDLEKCKKIISDTLDILDKQTNLITEYNLEFAPFENRTFYGFSRLAEVANLGDFLRVNLEEFYNETVERCQQGTNLTNYNRFCFDALYMYTLIVEKLKIQPRDVIIGHKENIETVTGSMVYHSRSIQPRKAGCLIGKSGLAFVIFSLLVFTGLGTFLMRRMRRIKLDTLV